MLGGVAAVEIDRLDAAIFIAHIASPVDWIQGYTSCRERKEVCPQNTSSTVVPYYRCVVLCC